MQYIILILLSLSFLNAEANTTLLNAKTARAVEASYNKQFPSDGGTWKLQKDQAFEVDLNPKTSSHSIFAAFTDGQVRFVLLSAKDNSVIQTLPKSELAVTGIFAFEKIKSVMFKDINRDGILDILILTSYFDSRPVQGEGVGGGSIDIGFVFVSHNDKYDINEDCGEDVRNIKALEKCASKLFKK